MATVFWDSEGVVLVDFLEAEKTVTGTYYVEVLRKLRAKLAEKHPGKLHCGRRRRRSIYLSRPKIGN